MAKLRVYELANNLGIEVERAIELLREVGAAPRNHFSVVERVPARRVRQLLKQNAKAALPPTQIQASPGVQVVPPPDIEQITKAPENEGAASSQVASDAAKPPAKAEPSSPQDAKTSEADVKKAAPQPAVKETVTADSAEKTAEERSVSDAKIAVAEEAEKVRDEAKETAAAAAVVKENPEVHAPKKAAAQEAKSEKTAKPEKAPEARKTNSAAQAEVKVQETPASAKRSGDAGTKKTAAKTDVKPQAAEKPEARQTQRKAAAATKEPAAAAKAEAEPKQRSQRSAARSRTVPTEAAAPVSATTRKRRRQQTKVSDSRKEQAKAAKPTGPVVIPDSLTVQELADILGVPATQIILRLMEVGVMAAINQQVEFEVAAAVAEKLGYEVKRPEKKVVAHEIQPEDDENLEPRPPVVTIMGHVDHGKTTLLDVIRKTRVAESEAGGITQHIGAYQIEVNGQRITFLDTPGHEAFTAMRSRGAQVTDIAVLVVAADDGVMPQTIEAINHAKAADVPIIVAINKMDRPGANPDRIKQQLAEHNLIPEEWGGDTICVEVSALQREGIDELLEMILLVAEIQELRANPNRPAAGVVIEAELDKNRGPVANVLVQTGTLRIGDSCVVGAVYGRVRAMYDEMGNSVEEAGPSRPVSVLGLSDVPQAGDLLEVVADDREARQIAEQRAEEQRLHDTQLGAGRIRLSEIHSRAKDGDVKDLNLLLKADVQGSVEALRGSIEKIESPEVRINIIHAAVGGITESDVNLAAASDAVIIGFNVRPEPTARRVADRENVEIRLYRVIYEAIEDIEKAVEGLLEPTYEEVVLGRAEIRALFRVPGVGTVAGCYVTEGRIVRQAEARLIRDHVVIHEGKLASLKRFKDDVREVQEGYECGLSFENYQDLKEGDVVEVFRMEEVK